MCQDQSGKVPLYWGITADGYVAIANDSDLLKGACGKSLASFPQGGLSRASYYNSSTLNLFSLVSSFLVCLIIESGMGMYRVLLLN